MVTALFSVPGALIEWVKEPEQLVLRRDFTVWLKRVFLPARMPGIDFQQVRDLQEVNTMLAERVIEWTKEWERQGMEKGMERGMKKGIEQGLKKVYRTGETAFFIRLLEHKFGSLDDTIHQRIEEADEEKLLAWGERTLSASRLEEVFENRSTGLGL